MGICMAYAKPLLDISSPADVGSGAPIKNKKEETKACKISGKIEFSHHENRGGFF